MGGMTTTRQPQPQFLRIKWEASNEDTGEAVTLEASLCLTHRREIALNDSARAAGQFGDSCDLCRGRQPQFLRIRWEATNEAVTLEASLCLAHRLEIDVNSSARPAGQFGESCDYCTGRQPGRGKRAE